MEGVAQETTLLKNAASKDVFLNPEANPSVVSSAHIQCMSTMELLDGDH